ncbi:MAG: hypothetical protein ACLTLL_05595 [Acutalibacteraceae bacterium]
MSDGVLLGIFASFVLIGVVSISYYILLKILHPRSNGRYIVVIPARTGMTDVAGKGYAQRLRSGMLGDKEAVVILDLGMDEKQIEECRRMCRSCEGLYLCSPANLKSSFPERIYKWRNMRGYA